MRREGRHLRGIAIFSKDSGRRGNDLFLPELRPRAATSVGRILRRCAHLYRAICPKQFPSANGFHRLPPPRPPPPRAVVSRLGTFLSVALHRRPLPTSTTWPLEKWGGECRAADTIASFEERKRRGGNRSPGEVTSVSYHPAADEDTRRG